jgi:Tol biopolymer transport system component
MRAAFGQIYSTQGGHLYRIPVDRGKPEIVPGQSPDDGPEYSPDRKFIYFHSSRGGLKQIWRKKPDGSDEEQLTPDDGYDNSHPRLSPDGQRMSFFTSEKSVTGHPENRDVMLRVMNLGTRQITVLARLFGAQTDQPGPRTVAASRS